MNAGRNPKRLNAQLLKGHPKKLKGEKLGSRVATESTFLHAGLIKRKESLSCPKTLQKEQAYIEALKRDEDSDMLSAALSCHHVTIVEHIHTHMHTETKHSLLIEYSGILQEIFRRKVRREVVA